MMSPFLIVLHKKWGYRSCSVSHYLFPKKKKKKKIGSEKEILKNHEIPLAFNFLDFICKFYTPNKRLYFTLHTWHHDRTKKIFTGAARIRNWNPQFFSFLFTLFNNFFFER